ncbi:MAG: hypothetical protein II940_00650 [Methanosarcinaceae archaeon]|nr:hypothetical protein [Methanosarcinaceae archaeon]
MIFILRSEKRRGYPERVKDVSEKGRRKRGEKEKRGEGKEGRRKRGERKKRLKNGD